MQISDEVVHEAANFCLISYEIPKTLLKPQNLKEAVDESIASQYKPDFILRRNIYWIGSECLAFLRIRQSVEEEDGMKRAYVVFRGTENDQRGNWLFANLQMHKRKFAEPNFQVAGTMHMGFFRAFHWLWYTQEPLLDEKFEKHRRRIFYLRHSIFLGMVVLLGIRIGVGLPLLVWVLLWVILLLVELGVVEGFWKKKPEGHKDHIADTLERLRDCDQVVFCGHSLGGAMATIAFASYSTWRRNHGLDSNALLVTFGAPRIGDQQCMEHFEKTFGNSGSLPYAHYRHVGDVVPLVPCSLKQALGFFKNGVGVATLLVLFGVARQIYALMYAQSSPGEWGDKRAVRWVGHCNDNEKIRLRLLKWHPMMHYKNAISEVGCDNRDIDDVAFS